MRHVVAGSVLMIGLLAGTSTLSFASPSTRPMPATDQVITASHASNILQADYYYNHHRYHHRRWDRRHHRWVYY